MKEYEVAMLLVAMQTNITLRLKGHITSAASFFSAMRDNINIDDIFKTAGWNNNKTFEFFYNKTITMD